MGTDQGIAWCKFGLMGWQRPSSLRIKFCEGWPVQALWLCSTEELGRLGNPALGLAVSRERLRLMRLHAHLFRLHNAGNAKEPEISQDSFIWAHCLVRSRALDLTADQVACAR